MRAIEKAKSEMGFSIEEEEQFKGLWDNAKKDESDRLSSQALYEAILNDILKQAQLPEQNSESSRSSKTGALSHRAKAVFEAKNQLAQRREPDTVRIREEIFNFFKAHEKTFYGAKNLKRDDSIHLNLGEIRENMRSFEVLIDADGNKDMEDQFAIWGLLINIIPRGDQYMGRHGHGLITYAELLQVLDHAERNGDLVLKTESAADLNGSEIFFDYTDLELQKAPSSSDKHKDDLALKHNEYMKVVQNDAKRLADRLNSNYSETTVDKAMAQVCEIVDYILDENQQDVLGHSPESLQQVM